MGKQTDGQVKIWTYKHTERHTSQMDRYTDGRWVSRQMERESDGQKDKWADRQTNRWIDGQAGTSVN
jgi:hypothetical protein